MIYSSETFVLVNCTIWHTLINVKLQKYTYQTNNVCLPACTEQPKNTTAQIFIKFDTGNFTNIC